MCPIKYNSYVGHILIIGIFLLILSAWCDVTLSAWQPPIGIPAPSFGIDETVDMYIGQQYNFTDGRGTIDYPISPVTGKPYTHYVNMNDGSATDTGNTYGTPGTPRLTIPTTLPPGSIVEIHGGDYPANYTFNSIGGSSSSPVYIRGDTGNKPTITGNWLVSGGSSYAVFEGLDFTANTGDGTIFKIIGNSSYISIRDVKIHDRTWTKNGSGIAATPDLNQTIHDIVIYDVEIYSLGDWQDPIDHDYHGVKADMYGRNDSTVLYNFWVLDSLFYYLSGDAVQIMGDHSMDTGSEDYCHHIYIGGNTCHHCRQVAFWSKESNHCVISQNLAYSIYTQNNQQGAGAGYQYGPDNLWIIFNTFYDCNYGVRCSTQGTAVPDHKIYIIGNLMYDMIDEGLANWGEPQGAGICLFYGSGGASGMERYIINNTIAGCKAGIQLLKGASPTYLYNNIVYDIDDDHTIHFEDSDMDDYTTMDYNLYYDPDTNVKFYKDGHLYTDLASFQAASGKDTNSKQQDPLFTDSDNDDYSIQATSPAIDNARSSGMVDSVFDTFYSNYGIDIRKDLTGKSRSGSWDVGAYEGSSSDPTNPTPVLQPIGDKTVDENATLTFNINATDNDPITYSAQGLPSGAILNPQTGDFVWTPSYSQAGSYSVTFRASDGNSLDSETITITVNNINRAPILGAISDQSVNENALLSFSVNATDPDSQTLTYSVSGLPNGAVFANQTFTWIPAYDQAGTFALTFTVDDGQAQDSQAITITVNNVNRAPVLTAINDKSVWSDDALTFTVNATDPDGDTVTYSANTVPSGATFITQTFDWTPTPTQIGSYNVTFYASDGQLQDSQTITITVNVDTLAPTVTNLSPAAGAIQVPLNNLVTLNITDAGKGINPNSVKIKVKTNSNPNNTDVYFGDLDHDISLLGDCRRIGNNSNYMFVFQPTQDLFYYDQTVTITVNATDLAGNVMNPYIYSFVTEMHLFGQNTLVNTNLDNNDRPVTVCDSNGNIWAAWHTGSAGSRDIYIGSLAAGADNFGSTTQITNNATDQCNPALALDSNDKLYAVWQDNRNGNWDIYMSTSVDGINWSVETMVNDPEDGQVNPVSNEINPAIVIGNNNDAHVVWQDDLAGNQDIFICTSNDGFVTTTISQITSDNFDQVEPAVAANSANTIYVVWTDYRNGSSDIYGAASNSGPWTNVALVNNANNQSSPVIATESTGTILHLLWVDDTPGDKDIYYASSNNDFQGINSGSSIIDDTSGADQLEPTIAITGTTSNNDLKVFACWQDWRNADTDLYFTELNAGSGTNVFVNDGGSGAYQGEPAIGTDEYGHPYLIWADDRSTNTDIYFAGSTCIEPIALATAFVSASAPSSTIVGVDPQTITNVDDVSIVIPSGACSYDADISIVTISNHQVFAVPCLGSYDFGPSGIQFNQPVTITIPYVYANSNGSTVPYWFNSLTGTLSQQGITNIQDIVISPTLHAISFETTHFTPFYLLGGGGGVAGVLGGGGGGGGCSVTAGNEGNIVEFALPYIVLIVVMAILKKRDSRVYGI